MPFNARLSSSPVGPFRGKVLGYALLSTDVDFDPPVTLEATAAGTVKYRTVDNDENTETLADGDVISVCGVAVLIDRIYGSSTLATADLGKL